jgi:hypothetical protein
MLTFETKDDRAAFDKVYTAFTNQGYVEHEDGSSDVLEVNDLVATPDVARFIPQVVETVVREALEPQLLIIPNLFEQVSIERGSRVQIGAIGALSAAEVPEGGEYKQVDIQMDGGDMVAVNISKHGLMIKVTDEVITENQFDIIGLWLRAAAKALARHKEQYAMRLINEMGITVFDNTTPASAMYGSTTGRDITGAGNGSMTANDIWDMYAELMLRGFSADTALMHPLGWRCFMNDPEMREQVLKGSTLATRQAPKGSFAKAWGTSHGGLGVRHTATGQETVTQGTSTKIGASAWVNTLNALGATFNLAPQYLPTPLRVLVTPYIPYTPPAGSAATPYSGRTNVIMADSSNCGILVTKENVTTEEFDDPARDIRSLKLRERWGMAFVEQGKSITKAANIAIARNYVFENTNAITLGNLSASTAY